MRVLNVKAIVLLVWGLIMTGCVSSSDSKGYMINHELDREIREGNAPIIIDVRSQGEYEVSHLPGAVHISFWATYFNTEKIAASSSDLIVVYCEHGPRAGIGKFGLYLAGFENIKYLKGHMAQWKRDELSTEK